MLGKGAQGWVHRAICESDRKVYAIKIILDDMIQDNFKKLAIREAHILKKIDHENIIKVYDYFKTSD